MASQWTSKYAIMRDLSLAQGSDVPANLESTVGLGEKPPRGPPEEIENEYFGHWVDDGDAIAAPDLGLIKQMLELVQDKNVSPDEDESDNFLVISKPCQNTNETNNNKETKVLTTSNDKETKVITTSNNKETKEITTSNNKETKEISTSNNKEPNENGTTIQSVMPKTTKKKRENVALNSILTAIAENTPPLNMAGPSEPLKLLKPTDFISTDKEIVDSVEKVNSWFNTQQAHIDVNATSTKPSNKFLEWEPSSMFKRKNGSTVKSTENDSSRSSPQQQVSTAAYQPSSKADEYYQKFVESSKMLATVNTVREDVWTRAERLMKEIDEKNIQKIKEQEAIKESESDVNNSDGSNLYPEAVRLPEHRHTLGGACVVCEAEERHRQPA